MKFSCERCLYSTDLKICFERHKLSKTHIKKETDIFEGRYQCKICNKTYKSNCGYYTHTKKCKKRDDEEKEKKKKDEEEIRKIIIELYKQNNEIINKHKEILKENSEMKNLLVEISKKENNITNIENNTNSHNKIKKESKLLGAISN